ncbi:hypothetical protein BCON_0051g00420 [Botryotinia convoluta]|uniref:Uncharacterized protein n=1 Tax=Botryotinia convoluta TaxID=54673 RepID=A0A4Z1IGU1_9HELO|nr:hypothetical protein BCON_0051g00420 [Botryotinia convoluta]
MSGYFDSATDSTATTYFATTTKHQSKDRYIVHNAISAMMNNRGYEALHELRYLKFGRAWA